MAPRKAAKQKIVANNRPPSIGHAFDPPPSQLSQESQDNVTQKVEDAINNSKQQARKRRKERHDAVFRATNARCDELRGLIDEAYRRHEDRCEGIRHTKLERLEQLLQQREELEQSLDDDEAAMDKLYMTMAEKLQIALDSRVEVLA